MLWLIVVGSLVAAGTLGLWCQTRSEEKAALAKIIAEAAVKEADRVYEKDAAGLQPPEFWAARLGRGYVFTVRTQQGEHSFVGAADTVFPRGIVVQDRMGENLFLDYGTLRWGPASAEDHADPMMVITPPELPPPNEDEEEEIELV